jgi:xanthine dehydrogenase accessory factor
VDLPLVILRGGGDLATGVAARLHRSGFAVIVTEVGQPRAVRRLVALAQAVYAGEVVIEDLHGQIVASGEEAIQEFLQGKIPVVVDPDAKLRFELPLIAIVDARMRKRPPEIGMESAPLVIGLGPGFTAGLDCHAIVETNRGHHMGRVIWERSAQSDTGVPEPVAGHAVDRVLRAPSTGTLKTLIPLGTLVHLGDTIASVDGDPLRAPFDGALRGLLHGGLEVKRGEKVGDLDPRGVLSYCYEISDKSLAVGGGVLEVLLSRPEIRRRLRG